MKKRGEKKCPDVQKIVLKEKKNEMEIAAATETRARDKRRDETRQDKTRQDKQARRGDATLLHSRSLTRGLQIEDTK